MKRKSDSDGPCAKGDTLRIGELASRSGKTVRAIHLYDQMGLLRACDRTVGGFRLYPADAELRIRWIDRLQDLGFSLCEIREFAAQVESKTLGPQAATILRERFEEKLAETRRTIAELSALAEELKVTLEYLDPCHQCIPPLPVTACPECDVPRARPGRPVLVSGFFARGSVVLIRGATRRMSRGLKQAGPRKGHTKEKHGHGDQE